MIIYLLGIVFCIFFYRHLQLTFVLPVRDSLRKYIIELKTKCPACKTGVYSSYELCKLHYELLETDNPLIRPPAIFYGGTWSIVGSAILWPITLTIVLAFHLADITSVTFVTCVTNIQSRISETHAVAIERKNRANEQLNHAQRERDRVSLQKETFSVLDSLTH